MPRENRAPESVLQERYRIIQELIVQGKDPAQIVRHCLEHFDWNVSERQHYNYVKSAFEALADNASVNRAAYFVLVLERNKWLYNRALAEDDYRLARLVTLDLINLLKLDSPQADFDWKAAAAKQGLNPDDILARMKRLTVREDQEAARAHG